MASGFLLLAALYPLKLVVLASLLAAPLAFLAVVRSGEKWVFALEMAFIVALLAVFPISQRLRYLIPFADVEASLEYLAARRGRVATLTLVDDGEKFGVWPGTHARVYGEGWLDRFFDRLLAADWLELTTFADVRDRLPATGRVYLPTASYREMGEWALPAPAARFLEAARARLERLPRGDELAALLRGGFWRHFLAKYPEVADVYWKMLRLSHAIHRARETRPEDPARAIQLPLVELHVLVPQRDHRHPPPSRLLVMYIVYRSMNISSRPTSPTTSSGPWSSGLASARATCRRTRSPPSSPRGSGRRVLKAARDTQVILRGAASATPSVTSRIYAAWDAGRFTSLLSDPILTEVGA